VAAAAVAPAAMIISKALAVPGPFAALMVVLLAAGCASMRGVTV
jgi:hypothetical protein